MAVILAFEAQLGASREQIHRLLLEPMVTLWCLTILGMSVSSGDSKGLAKCSEMCIEYNIEFCLFFFFLCCVCYTMSISILNFPKALLGCSRLSSSL